MNGKRLIGLYPGTFDPVTLGHLDIIKRAVKLVDHLVIGVATNAPKNPIFTLEERVAMVKDFGSSCDFSGPSFRNETNSFNTSRVPKRSPIVPQSFHGTPRMNAIGANRMPKTRSSDDGSQPISGSV